MPPSNPRVEKDPSAEAGHEIKVVDAAKPPDDLESDFVSISLKYFQKKAECFSAWQQRDLKDFSNLIGKLANLTWDEVKASKGPTCHKHINPVKVAGFNRPDSIGDDISFHNIHVGGKARIHGFGWGSVFYLVWLDRNHKLQ